MKRFLAGLLLLSSCAVPSRVREQKPVPQAAVSAHAAREMLVYVPQTDEGAAAWPKWFVKYPELRMVIAMSPRFTHLEKDLSTKSKLQALQKAGRLEIAMQIPNAPILPLLIDSNTAKDSLPHGAVLPNPPYAYPDDVIQLIAQSKAGFFKEWNFLPHGLVLPYGAASPKLIALLERLGITWTVAALEAPAIDGAYQSGALLVWDAAPAGKPGATRIRVWDERQAKDRPLDSWILEIKSMNGQFMLPQDSNIQTVPIESKGPWKYRTWTEKDWSMWIGSPPKNEAWSALRKTREALEAYKNSGQASVQRLDVAFEELYGAQNSNYFMAFGNNAISPALVEEREHEFQATLTAAYRLISQSPPEDLFRATNSQPNTSVRVSSTTTYAELLPDGREHVQLGDAVGDAIIPGGPDIRFLDVWASTDSVQWIVTLTTPAPSAVIDIYVDLNGQPNAGTPSFLAGRTFVTSPMDAWEYAISLVGQTATLYRTQSAGTYGIVQTFPIVSDGSAWHVTIPREVMRGSPKRWGYQVLAMTGDPAASPKSVVSDFLDPLEISQKELWEDLSTNKRSDIPFVRVRSR